MSEFKIHSVAVKPSTDLMAKSFVDLIVKTISDGSSGGVYAVTVLGVLSDDSKLGGETENM